jgi:heat shock protein HslJ/membrane-bound inhibitor of C-type lysozyme
LTYLHVLAVLPVLLSATALSAADTDTRTISGQLSYMQRVALSPDSEAVVEFRTADDQLQGETRFGSEERQVPLPFALEVPADAKGLVRAAIWSGGRPAWLSDPVAVEASDQPLELGTLMLKPFTPIGFTSRMRCGETELEIGFIDDHARMRVDGQTIDIYPVPAASGAKFAAQDDADTYFWSKGNSAMVSLAGDVLPECLTAVPADQAPFRARGNEPGWNLEIRGNRLALTLDYGARQLEAKLPKPIDNEAMRVYELPERDLSIRISNQPCRDSMTGMPYPSTVAIEIEDRELNGCGGEPRALLEGPEWIVRSLAGEPIAGEVSVTINFLEDSRVAGSSGCNRFMGGYQLTGEGLSFEQLAGTMMACPEPQMRTEQRFLGLMHDVMRFEILPDKRLALITAEGEQIIAER